MPTLRRCAVHGCTSWAEMNDDRDKSMHRLPFHGDTRPEAILRRRRWIDFVRKTRANWVPFKCSYVCSEHFTREDFMQDPTVTALLPIKKFKNWLKRDSFGVSSYPTVYPELESTNKVSIVYQYDDSPSKQPVSAQII